MGSLTNRNQASQQIGTRTQSAEKKYDTHEEPSKARPRIPTEKLQIKKTHQSLIQNKEMQERVDSMSGLF